MNVIGRALLLSALLGTAAYAAGTVPPPRCEEMAKIKAEIKDAKLTVLTPGQYHFIEGVYVASPITPPGGLPPGDGAILMEIKEGAGIIWTHGSQGCMTPIVIDQQRGQAAYIPMPVPAQLLSILRAIKSGKTETVAPAEDTSKDLHL